MPRATPYDLVILDLMLPDMDGLDVTHRLRQRGQAVPVLMLTARGTLEDRVAGLDIGARIHLNPISYAPGLRRHVSGIWLLCTPSTTRSIDTLITAAVGT